ncbi:MAG TPA: hypothetical protein VGZ90_13260 [Puia sp.]|jgi:hypothetical protein|nr:hypothetical protein [Puia sp.]
MEEQQAAWDPFGKPDQTQPNEEIKISGHVIPAPMEGSALPKIPDDTPQNVAQSEDQPPPVLKEATISGRPISTTPAKVATGPGARILTFLKASEKSGLWENITPILKVMLSEHMTIADIKTVVRDLWQSGQISLPSANFELFGTIKSGGAHATEYYGIDDINIYAKII